MFDNIIDVQKTNRQEVYDLEIDSRFHNFYCNNILVHNCVSYSYVSWQMLYLKTYYPAYYYSSLFKFENKERYTELINDMFKNNINLLPPRIDKSVWDFNTLSKTEVLMGFNVIKSFGDKAYNELMINKDKLNSLKDFMSIDFSKINKSSFDALLNTGCFDHWGYNRNYIKNIKELIQEGKIETWFTRKKNALELKTKPQILNNIEDNLLLKLLFKYKNISLEKKPWIDFIFEIFDLLDIKTDDINEEQKDILFYNSTEFSLYYIKRLQILNDYKKDINNYNTFENIENSQDMIVFIISKIEEAQSKKGKKYYQLEISDGTEIKHIKLWQEKTELKRNDICLATFNSDKYGISINTKEKIIILEK